MMLSLFEMVYIYSPQIAILLDSGVLNFQTNQTVGEWFGNGLLHRRPIRSLFILLIQLEIYKSSTNQSVSLVINIISQVINLPGTLGLLDVTSVYFWAAGSNWIQKTIGKSPN